MQLHSTDGKFSSSVFLLLSIVCSTQPTTTGFNVPNFTTALHLNLITHVLIQVHPTSLPLALICSLNLRGDKLEQNYFKWRT